MSKFKQILKELSNKKVAAYRDTARDDRDEIVSNQIKRRKIGLGPNKNDKRILVNRRKGIDTANKKLGETELQPGVGTGYQITMDGAQSWNEKPDKPNRIKKALKKKAIKEGEMDNNQAAAPGKKKPKPGFGGKQQQQMPKDQNDQQVDPQQPNKKPLTGKDPVKGVTGVDNQEKINLNGPKTQVDLEPELEVKNPPLGPGIQQKKGKKEVKKTNEATLLEKLKNLAFKDQRPNTHHRQINYGKRKVQNRGTYKAKPYNVVDVEALQTKVPAYVPAGQRTAWLNRHRKGHEIGYKKKGAPQAHIAEGQFVKDVKDAVGNLKRSWKDMKRGYQPNKNYFKGKKPIKEGEVITKYKHEFEGKKAMAQLTRMRGETKKKEGKVLPLIKKTVNEMTAGKLVRYVKGGMSNIAKRKEQYHAKPSDARANDKKIKQRTGNIHKALDKLAENNLSKVVAHADDHTLVDISKAQREALNKIKKKKAAEHKGEAFNEATKLVTVHYRRGSPDAPGGSQILKKRYKLPKKSDKSDVEFLHGHHQMIKTGHQKNKIDERSQTDAWGKSKTIHQGKEIADFLHRRLKQTWKSDTLKDQETRDKKHVAQKAAQHEDVVNELSKELLTRYTRGAVKDTQKVEKHYTDAVAKGDTKPDFVKMFRKVGNRAVGIKRAQRKIGYNVNEMAPPLKVSDNELGMIHKQASPANKANIEKAVKPKIRVKAITRPVQTASPGNTLDKKIAKTDTLNTKQAAATKKLKTKFNTATYGKPKPKIKMPDTKPYKPTPGPMKTHSSEKPGIPHGYIYHPHPDHPNDPSKGTWGHPPLAKKQTSFQQAGGTAIKGIRAADVLSKRSSTPPPPPKAQATNVPNKNAKTIPAKKPAKHGMNGAQALVKGFFDKLQHNDTQISPTLRIIREAAHARGGGAKGEGSAGQDTAGDEHPISVLRKAIGLGHADMHHQDGTKTSVDRHSARHLLGHYESLKNPDHKIQVVSRMWHSAGEFENVHHGRPAKAGTFGTEKERHWSLKGTKQAA